MSFIVGTYAAHPANPDDLDAFIAPLASSPLIGGLAVPFTGGALASFFASRSNICCLVVCATIAVSFSLRCSKTPSSSSSRSASAFFSTARNGASTACPVPRMMTAVP